MSIPVNFLWVICAIRKLMRKILSFFGGVLAQNISEAIINYASGLLWYWCETSNFFSHHVSEYYSTSALLELNSFRKEHVSQYISSSHFWRNFKLREYYSNWFSAFLKLLSILATADHLFIHFRKSSKHSLESSWVILTGSLEHML